MFKLLRKNQFSALLALLLSAMSPALMADDSESSDYIVTDYNSTIDYNNLSDCNFTSECCPSNRMYIGGFGGELYPYTTRMSQTGTAFFTEAAGGPLAVDARGDSDKKTAGYGGVQIGYEWRQSPLNLGCSNWNITPAAEVEALFYRHKKTGHLANPSIRLPEHDFVDTFPMRVGVFFINGVLTLNNCSWNKISPYVGGGIGAARISIRRATSFQIDPPEAGINHFNSDRSDSSWTFAAQARAGLRYNICERIHLFAEYRFVYVDSSRYIFGSTSYPNHAPTSTWNVDIKNICYNAFAVGLQFDL